MLTEISKRTRGESGNALVITLIILFAITAIGATLAMVSSLDLKIAGNQRASTRALPIAEAGLNEAIHRLSLPNPTNVTIGGWTGNIAISDNDPYNPNWTAYIYLTTPDAAPPAASADEYSTGTIQNPADPYLVYSAAGGTDEVLTIRHKWRDVNGNNVRDPGEIVRWDPLQMPPENLTNGFPVEVVSVTGYQTDARRMIEAEVTKRVITVRTLGALYTNNSVNMLGNVDVCGYNHRLDTPVNTVPNGCYAYHHPSGHLAGVATTADTVGIQGAVTVTGYPTPTNNDAANPWYSLAEVLGLDQSELDAILANPTNTSIVNPCDGITYIIGDANVASNLVGSGLLYITGDLKGAGSFVWKGLVYVEGKFMLTGNPWILGSMIVKGTSTWDFTSGNAAILYSKDALTKYLSDQMPCIMLSWSER